MGSSQSQWLRYGLAVASVVAATALRLLLGPVLGNSFPFATLFLAVVVSARYAGLGPAVVATVLGAVAFVFLLLPNRDGVIPRGVENQFGLVLYVAVGLGISYLGGSLREARRRAEGIAARAIRQREELQTTLTSIGDAVIVTDAEGRITSMNPVAEALTGWGSQDAAGQPLKSAFAIVYEQTRQPVENRITQVRRDGTVVGLESHTLLISRDGTERPIEAIAAPIKDAGNLIVGVVIVFRDASERRRAELVRRHLAAIVESSDDAIIGKSLDGSIASWNAGAERLYGYAAAEVVGKPVTVLIPPGRTDEVDETVQRLQRGERLQHFETQRRRKDGSLVDVSVSYSPIHGSEGSIVGTAVITRDITDRKRTEAALRAWQNQLELVTDNAPVCIAHCTPDRRFKFVNKPYAARFGLHPRDLVGRTFGEVIGDAAAAAIEPHVAAVLSGRRVEFETEIVYRDVGVRHVQCVYQPELDSRGQVIGYVAALLDVTDSKRTERALRESEVRFAAVVNHTPACVFAKDRRGRYLFANNALAALVGRTANEFPGRTDVDFFPADVAEQFAKDDAAVVDSGQSRTYEETFRVGGVSRTYLTVKFPLRDEHGASYAACAVATDVTDLKKTRDDLQSTAARLGLALAASQLGDWSWSVASDLVELSPRAAAIFGIPVSPPITWTALRALLHDDDRDATRRQVETAVEGHSQYDVEYRVNRADGTQVWVAALGRAHYSPEGQPLGMYGVVQDVTPRKLAEEAVRDDARTTEMLHRVGKALTADLDLQKIVQTVTDEATALTGAQFGAFFYNVLNDRGEAYTLYTISGVPRDAFSRFPMPRNTEIFEPTFRGRGVVRLDDVTADPRYGRSAPHHGMPAGHLPVRSYLAVSVVSRTGSVIGGLFFGHAETGRFTPRHERLVEGIAAQAAVAIDNAQLYQRVQESEARLSAVVNHSPAAITLKDAHGRYVLVNRKFEELARSLGAAGPYLGRTDADVFPPALAARFRARDDEVLRTKRIKVYEETVGEAGGVPRTGLTTAFPLLTEAGEVRAVCGVNLDITDRVRAERALRESEERLRLALDAGRMGVWDWNVKTNAIQWSDNLEPVHGLAPGSFGGTFDAFQQLIYPADRELVSRAVARSLEERSSYDVEFRNVWPDGSIHWMAGKGKVFVDQEDQSLRMIGVGMDITDRKRNEVTTRFLADASATLSGLVDYESTLQKVARLAVPAFADWCAVDVFDAGGAVRRVAVVHTDPTRVELAHEFHRRYPPDPAATHGLWHVAKTGRSELVAEITEDMLGASVEDPEQLAILLKLGLRSYMGVPLSIRGKVLGVVTFVAAESGRRFDAADVAAAEDLAHRAAVAVENARLYQEVREADRKKDEFLALLAHELRNPLAPIRNAIQIMKLAGTTGDVAERAREMAERQVQALTRMVDDLLDVSRIMRGKVELRRERVDVAVVIQRAVETARPAIDGGKHVLAVELPDAPVWIDADVVRLAQVVSNLLNNSAKYTEPGGRVRLSALVEGDEVVIRVRDSGIGMAHDILKSVFDMFMQVDATGQRAQGGLGIGLTVVKSLVEMHGGTVEARSEGLGKGSEFVVRLPLAQELAPGPEQGDAGGERGSNPGRRIVVVDDNADAAESLAVLLELEGHAVRVAHDGPSGLKLVEDDPPDIAFLDIGMPGMSGHDVAVKIRNNPRLRGVLLVAMTGWGQDEDRRRTREAGFDAHLVKPVEPEALHRIVASCPSKKV